MMTAIVASSMLMLSACSLVEQANQSLSYVSGATDYINQVSSAGTELQQLATDAINNPDVTGQLQEKIDLIQAEAAEFSEMSAPAIGENIHENLVSYNIQLTEVMNQFETSIAEQGITAENWEKTGIPELINNINSLKEPLSGLQTE
jgi:TolA-binding protein